MGGGSATLIRHIPINHSRVEWARRLGSRGKACLDEVVTILPAMFEAFLTLDEPPIRLAEHDLLQDKVVDPHFLADLSEEESANVPDVSTRTVKRDWRSTRAWLHSRLAGTTA
jgi:hypothetical protein